MKEVEWKPVVGYEDLYEVSNDGRVRSLNYRGHGYVHELRPALVRGYLQVTLCKNDEKKLFKVHRLVATTFIPNPQNLPVINHLDENKQNNHVSNLEFCTHKYNNHYSDIWSKSRRPILQYNKDGVLVAEYESVRSAERQSGVNDSSISMCCSGKIKSAGGFIWKYKE